MSSPSVFVSSTCYDLRQVRTDLGKFLTELGLDPVLSELASFPVDPDASTLENCLKAVEQRADIFALIIGGRYGSVVDHGKSITNLEFLRARAKGIPVYVFVERRVLDILPVWKMNPQATFETIVDTPKVFEFVASIRDSGERWVFPFDTAQDICSTLRIQLSYLFKEAIELRQRVYGQDVVPTALRHLRGQLLRLLIEQPPGWEYLFFAEAMQSELAKYRDLRRDWVLGIAYGSEMRFSVDELVRWMSAKNNEAIRLWGNGQRLFDTALQEALGPPGTQGNAEEIHYVAVRIGEVYRQILQWKLEFARVSVVPEAETLKKLGSCLCDNTVHEVEQYTRSLGPTFRDALKQVLETRQKRELQLTLILTAPDVTELTQETSRLFSLIKYGVLDPNSS